MSKPVKKQPSTVQVTVDELKDIRRQLNESKAKAREEHEWRMRLHTEVEELKKSIQDLTEDRKDEVNDLVAEWYRLRGEIIKINNRLGLLGYTARNPFEVEK